MVSKPIFKSESLPPFLPSHPPFMTDPDVLPPERTLSVEMAHFSIEKADFDQVVDPIYPWQNMPHNDPKEWDIWNQTKANKAKNVTSYLAVRSQFWKRTDIQSYGAETRVTITTTTGSESFWESSSEEEITQEIGSTLGLSLSGNIFDLGEGGLTSEFTSRLAHAWRFGHRESQTYRQEKMTSTEVSFLAGYQYLMWQVVESLSLYRVLNSGEPIFISTLDAATARTYSDSFNMKAQP